MPQTRKQRSEAALLGWETRRANEAARQHDFERRSAAAKLGWANRRERERDRWDFDETDDWIVEEPIDEVGDGFYE
jgi:hypothetical protein